MGPSGIHSKDAEGAADITVRLSLRGHGDHGRHDLGKGKC